MVSSKDLSSQNPQDSTCMAQIENAQKVKKLRSEKIKTYLKALMNDEEKTDLPYIVFEFDQEYALD